MFLTRFGSSRGLLKPPKRISNIVEGGARRPKAPNSLKRYSKMWHGQHVGNATSLPSASIGSRNRRRNKANPTRRDQIPDCRRPSLHGTRTLSETQSLDQKQYPYPRRTLRQEHPSTKRNCRSQLAEPHAKPPWPIAAPRAKPPPRPIATVSGVIVTVPSIKATVTARTLLRIEITPAASIATAPQRQKLSTSPVVPEAPAT